MDGPAACTDLPAGAEVLKHVAVNCTLGSELKREQSPGNGPWWQWWRWNDQLQSFLLVPNQPVFQRQCARNLSKRDLRGDMGFPHSTFLYTHGL